MRWPWKRRPFDRREVLAEADHARASGRRRQAIAGYRRVLEQHPQDLTVHARIAPLLAASGDRAGALASFRIAAEGQSKAGFHERSLSLLIQAVEHFPDEEPLWPEIARLHLQRGRRAEAVAALTGGGWRLHLAREYRVAERVLRLALEIDPGDADTVALLARTLRRSGRRAEAIQLLEELAAREEGGRRAAVQRLLFWAQPTPRRLWEWLRSSLGKG
jgi:tetratricopeptide (TPR) repeat protein